MCVSERERESKIQLREKVGKEKQVIDHIRASGCANYCSVQKSSPSLFLSQFEPKPKSEPEPELEQKAKLAGVSRAESLAMPARLTS